MSFDVVPIPEFVKELKGLAKKYRSLRSELAELGNELAEHPNMGTAIGSDCYKIRLAIKSKGGGKSGGARVITCWWRCAKRCTCCRSTTKASKTL